MKHRLVLVLGLSLALACHSGGTDPTLGNEALGISSFEINEVSNGTGDQLEIKGLDAQKRLVAHLTLSLGQVTLPNGRQTRGKRLLVRLRGGGSWEVISASEGPFEVDLDEAERLLFTDPHVVGALQRWGTTVHDPR